MYIYIYTWLCYYAILLHVQFSHCQMIVENIVIVLLFLMQRKVCKCTIITIEKVATDGLNDTIITTTDVYSLNITKLKNKICLSQHYNKIYNFCLLML